MPSDTEKLIQLQEIDLTIRNHKKRLAELARELANHQPVKKAQAILQKAESTLKPLQIELRDLELQVQSTTQKRERSQKQLYSGSISNPKELQDIENNIASLQRRQLDLEDRQLELMMTVDAAQDQLKTAQTNLDTVMQEAAASNKELLTEKDTLESEIDSLGDERENLVNTLNDDYLTLYNDLQPKMGFRPVARLIQDQTCSICGVQQTSLHAQQVRQSDELSRCNSCNRILIAI